MTPGTSTPVQAPVDDDRIRPEPTAGEAPTPRLAVRPGVSLAATAEGSALQITTPQRVQTIPLGDRDVVRALTLLQDRACAPSELLLSVTTGDGGVRRAGLLQAVLQRLQSSSVLDHVLHDQHQVEIARLTGSGGLPVTLASATPTSGHLSRLAVLTVEDQRVVVQSGVSHMKVVLSAAVLHQVVTGTLLDDPQIGPSVARLLQSAGVWDTGQEDDLEHHQWSPADLWFHHRSHEAGASDAYGGTFHLAESYRPLDFARPPTDRTVALPTPDLSAIRRADPPLADVVERRRSVRVFTEEHPSLEEVGELLYRTCRARGVFREEQHGLDVVDRPFPSGGSLHELDVYVLTPGGGPLDRGLWRYAPDRHEVDLVSVEERPLAALITNQQEGALLERPAPLGILITARFGRLMYKYQTMAYAALLKHVGVLYQTFYLNATAMGLGVCGLGGASTSHFAAASGESPLAEGLVGGLVAGRPGAIPESPWSTL